MPPLGGAFGSLRTTSPTHSHAAPDLRTRTLTPNDCDIETDHESSEGLSKSESEDDDPEASGLSNNESLEEEDHELLLQLFLTVSPEDDEHYAHQLS